MRGERQFKKGYEKYEFVPRRVTPKVTHGGEDCNCSLNFGAQVHTRSQAPLGNARLRSSASPSGSRASVLGAPKQSLGTSGACIRLKPHGGKPAVHIHIFTGDERPRLPREQQQ